MFTDKRVLPCSPSHTLLLQWLSHNTLRFCAFHQRWQSRDLQGVLFVRQTSWGGKECLIWKHLPFQTCKEENRRHFQCAWHVCMLRSQRWDFRCILSFISEIGASLLLTACDGKVWTSTALVVRLVMYVTHILHGLVWLGIPKSRMCHLWQ